MKKRRPRRPPRPCPACVPGVYCAACRGRGVNPKIRLDMSDRQGRPLVEPGPAWKWRGLYAGRWHDGSWGDLMPSGEHTVPGARGADMPANVRRRAASRALGPDEQDESRADPVAAFFADHSAGWSIEDGASAVSAIVHEIDPEAVRRFVGWTQKEFDAVAKRRTRRPLSGEEIVARRLLGRRIAELLDAATNGDRRTGAVELLRLAYGTSRAMLSRLRAEGRLR